MKALVIGGNRYFGKILVGKLLQQNIGVTVLNRGSIDDGFGAKIVRIKADRTNPDHLSNAVLNESWDIIFDNVAYDAKDAKLACQVFKNRTKRYIFISSKSVYTQAGIEIKESVFVPEKKCLSDFVTAKENYAEAKKQAEHVFMTEAAFPIVCVRLPIVLGREDYTGRLKFHVDHIREGKPIYFPNLKARMSFIEATDAAQSILELGKTAFVGPINVCAKDPISMIDMLKILENKIGKKAVISSSKEGVDASPFGIEKDWYMNTDLLKALGINPRPINDWLADLVEA